MNLYGIDSLSVDGEGKWLNLGKLREFAHIRALSLNQEWYTSIKTLQTFVDIEYFRVLDLCDETL